MWCTIAKAGSTQIRTYLAREYANNTVTPHAWIKTLPLQSQLAPDTLSPVRVVPSSDLETQLSGDPNTVHVAVVRHPLVRAYSAFARKKEYGALHKWYPWLDANITFLEFMHEIVALQTSCVHFHSCRFDNEHKRARCARNEHWEQQVCFCGLMWMHPRYTVVPMAAAGTLIADLVERGLPASEALTTGFNNRASTSKALFAHDDDLESQHRLLDDRHWRTLLCHKLTPAEMTEIESLYAADMAMFRFTSLVGDCHP